MKTRILFNINFAEKDYLITSDLNKMFCIHFAMLKCNKLKQCILFFDFHIQNRRTKNIFFPRFTAHVLIAQKQIVIIYVCPACVPKSPLSICKLVEFGDVKQITDIHRNSHSCHLPVKYNIPVYLCTGR